MTKKRRVSSTTGTKLMRCPFFVAHSENEVVCEGLIDGCRSCMRWKKPGDKAFHQRTFCEKEYTRCEMYCSIVHWKWPEEQA